MTPSALKEYLTNLIKNQLKISTMIWGPPGIGKSSIVAQISQEHKIDFIDLRLSQLAPTDLRGLPVAVSESDTKEKGRSTWYPPDFLPKSGEGILFLDELNMAPPAMQGVAQQLILDRKVGAYQVPEGWYIWAAGNRKEDRASVFEMPSPLANRFLHLEVAPDFESFKTYALSKNWNEQIIAFLSFQPNLLHKINPHHPCWPSPRSWDMANKLHSCKMDISCAVGEATALEFKAYIKLYENLPDLNLILKGTGDHIDFSKEPSIRYATTIGLTIRAANNGEEIFNSLHWLIKKGLIEWAQLFFTDIIAKLQKQGKPTKVFLALVDKNPDVKAFIDTYKKLTIVLTK